MTSQEKKLMLKGKLHSAMLELIAVLIGSEQE
jgi:hypothetical protein